MENKYLSIILFCLLPYIAGAQLNPLTIPDWNSSQQYLNDQILADTLPGGHLPPGRVYVLDRDGMYLWNRNVTALKSPDTLRLSSGGSGGYKPVIYFVATGTGATPSRPPAFMVQLTQPSMTIDFKDICVSGHFELSDTTLKYLQGGLLNIAVGGVNSSIYLDNCVLKTSNGNHLRTDGRAHSVIVTNSIFADMGYLGTSNLGSGKGLDLRANMIDTCVFQNCTFVNWIDRVIRHYQATAQIKYLNFSNNTVVNGMSYYGLLSLGKLDISGAYSITIKNNLYIDPYSLGNDTDNVRSAEMGDPQEAIIVNGTVYNKFIWILAENATVSGATLDISGNYFTVSDTGRAFLNIDPYFKNEGYPLSAAMLSKPTVEPFKRVAIQLARVPKVMVDLNRWYYGGNLLCSICKNYEVVSFPPPDYDRRNAEYYMNKSTGLNCDIRSNANLNGIGSNQWQYIGLPTSATPNLNGNMVTDIMYAQGWNLVSLCREPLSSKANDIYPFKVGSAFQYDPIGGRYMVPENDSLVPGNGYWINVLVSGMHPMYGPALGVISKTVTQAGWQLLGSRTWPVQVSSLKVSNGAVIAGGAYRYNSATGGYEATAVINPGEAVWVMVTGPCTLTIP